MRATLKVASTVFAASASMLVTAGASQAVGSTTADPSPSDPSVVVAYPEAGTGDHAGETFYPTGEISDDTTVVIANADGSLPGGVSLQQVKQQLAQQRAAVAAGKATANSGVAIPDAKSATTQSALPSWASPNTLLPAASGGHDYATIYNVWSKQYHGVNFLGGTDSTKINYVFNVTESTNQEAAGQGLGFYRGYNGSDFGTWSKFYGLGVASDGSNGGGAVPWGNTYGTATFMAKGTSLSAVVGHFWP